MLELRAQARIIALHALHGVHCFIFTLCVHILVGHFTSVCRNDNPEEVGFVFSTVSRAPTCIHNSCLFFVHAGALELCCSLRDHELEAAFESQAERLRMRDGKAQTYKEFICQVYVQMSPHTFHHTN